MFKFTYTPALDGIRGIAILSVMFFHSSVYNLKGGFIGVDIFFVLSGFLISTLIMKEHVSTGSVNFKKFFIRRMLRLMPAIVVLFAALWIAVFLVGSRFKTTPSLMLSTTLYTFLYQANLVLAFQWASWPAALIHLWSLAIEEQFYIVWPFILFFFLQKKYNPFYIVILVTSIVLILTWWQSYLWSIGSEFHRLYFASDTRVNSMLIGCLLAIIISRNWLPYWLTKQSVALIILSVIILAFCFLFLDNSSFVMYHGGFEGVAVTVCFLIIGVLFSKPIWKKAFEFKPLTYLGKISYGLYLWHGVIFFSVEKLPVTNFYLRFLMEMILSICIATLSYYLIEKQFLKLKTRYMVEGMKSKGKEFILLKLKS